MLWNVLESTTWPCIHPLHFLSIFPHIISFFILILPVSARVPGDSGSLEHWEAFFFFLKGKGGSHNDRAQRCSGDGGKRNRNKRAICPGLSAFALPCLCVYLVCVLLCLGSPFRVRCMISSAWSTHTHTLLDQGNVKASWCAHPSRLIPKQNLNSLAGRKGNNQQMSPINPVRGDARWNGYIHGTSETAEAQRGQLTCPRSHSFI